MKTTSLLLVAGLALASSLVVSSAAEPFLSPKAKDLAGSVRVVPGNSSDNINRSLQDGSPKGREQAYSLRRVQGTGSTVDLAHGQRPSVSPKDPRYEAAFRALRATEFQVAPLK